MCARPAHHGSRLSPQTSLPKHSLSKNETLNCARTSYVEQLTILHTHTHYLTKTTFFVDEVYLAYYLLLQLKQQFDNPFTGVYFTV